jgi:hypothetical protein
MSRQRAYPRAQFSLRALLLVVLALSFALGFGVQSEQRRRAAIWKLSKKGALVKFRSGGTTGNGVLASLGRNLGVTEQDLDVVLMEVGWSDEVSPVRRVVSDADVALLAQLRDVVSLVLQSDHISADSLVHIAALPRLSNLELIAPQIEERAIESLSDCKSLTDLTLQVGAIGDSGLFEVAKMQHLVRLCLLDVELSVAAQKRGTFAA